MTGKDLILYILSNNLENEPVYKDGKFIGLISVPEAAVKFNVGIATILTWIEQGKLTGIYLRERTYILGDCKLEGTETNE